MGLIWVGQHLMVPAGGRERTLELAGGCGWLQVASGRKQPTSIATPSRGKQSMGGC